VSALVLQRLLQQSPTISSEFADGRSVVVLPKQRFLFALLSMFPICALIC
jgi:hypothetical protein